ncbi:Ubiquinol-cytochrome C chaperone domain containing protein [Aphelenchoides fujianensis]|nr:Ubiquinol-cytochrome C chaperone domain containing protein [Aphelenchoides fujianensis]
MNRHLASFSVRILRPSSSAAVRPQRAAFSTERLPNQPVEQKSYGGTVQEAIKAGYKPPMFAWARRLFKRSTPPEGLDKEMIGLLDKSASQLYYDCANNYPYLVLIKAFELPDYMRVVFRWFLPYFCSCRSSWYKLTLLHTWLCLLRLQSSLDAPTYKRVQQGLLSSLWFDVDKRLDLIGEELNVKMNTKTDMRKMHGLYIQTIFEYDEGFLDSDCVLAAALWRNLYVSKTVEPVCLNNVVRYVRETAVFLESLDANEILVKGIKRWPTAERLAIAA